MAHDDLGYELDRALEDFLDKLYDIERDSGLEHTDFVRNVTKRFGYDIADPYTDWYDEDNG